MTLGDRVAVMRDDTSPRPLKAAVIGGGFAGRAHADALRRVPGVEIVGIAASSPEHGARVAAELDLPLRTDLDELLEVADVVHNCTPNDLHLDVGSRAAAAGCHLLTEKPLGRTPDEARGLAETVAAAGIIAAFCVNYRYYAAVGRMRELVATGELGAVTGVHATYLQDWLMTADPAAWRRVSARAGPSCTVADLGTHVFDLIRHVTGLEIASLAASVGSVLGDTDGLDDHAEILLELSNGATGAIFLSQVSAGHKNDLRLAIDGERGSVSWAQEHPDEIVIGRAGEATTIESRAPYGRRSSAVLELPAGHVEGWADALRSLVLDFYRAVRGEADAEPPQLADGVWAAELVAHTLTSASQRIWLDTTK